MLFFIKKIVTLIICRVIDWKQINSALDEYLVQENIEKIKLGCNSILYPEGSINNLTERKELISIGNYSHIRGELTTWPYSNKGIRIGDYCYVGSNSRIWSGEEIVIGNHVLIAHNVSIIDSNSHELDYLERREGFKYLIHKGHPKLKGSVRTNKIIIEDDVWISYNTCILKGVHIGQGAIIAAGAVVTHNVAPFTLVGGNPARVLKELVKK